MADRDDCRGNDQPPTHSDCRTPPDPALDPSANRLGHAARSGRPAAGIGTAPPGSGLSALSGDVDDSQPNHPGGAQQPWNDAVGKENETENAGHHEDRREQNWAFHCWFLKGVLIVDFPRLEDCTPHGEFDDGTATH